MTILPGQYYRCRDGSKAYVAVDMETLIPQGKPNQVPRRGMIFVYEE